ncbi:MAG: hypothetical protein MAG451_02803 [Anaerolineales bacterium]|nr:hypothetical protein [Anaerolineales bacterium]
MFDLHIWQFLVGAGDDGRHFRFGLDMVNAVHQQQVGGAGVGFEQRYGVAELVQRPIHTERHVARVAPPHGVTEVGGVVIAIAHVHSQHSGAVGCLPPELVAQFLPFIPHTAPENRRINAEPL